MFKTIHINHFFKYKITNSCVHANILKQSFTLMLLEVNKRTLLSFIVHKLAIKITWPSELTTVCDIHVHV